MRKYISGCSRPHGYVPDLLAGMRAVVRTAVGAFIETENDGPLCQFAHDCATITEADAARQIADGEAELESYLGDRNLHGRIMTLLPQGDIDTITVRRRLANAVIESGAGE